jgi:prepilin-type N-terminal cleavage/methylation domain-containing protein
MRTEDNRAAFTLIELLVVIAIISLLLTVMMPALWQSRVKAKSAVCLSRLRTLGQGLVLYANSYADALPPGRMPAVDDHQTRNRILGGIKYRPSFLAMMGNEVGLPPFEDPKASKTEQDRRGERGDRQNYASSAYVCSETPDWLDERNGSYGYNYQFLGNSRLYDTTNVRSYKNWSVKLSRVRTPGECVGVGDSMGTAATFGKHDRRDYVDNARDENGYGNEGFNLDPPRIDVERGEAAGFDIGLILRTAVHPRHGDKGAVLWLDVHASMETLESLGYAEETDGSVGMDGDNTFFSIDHVDRAWTEK